jgi:hypothetical protein
MPLSKNTVGQQQQQQQQTGNQQSKNSRCQVGSGTAPLKRAVQRVKAT